VCALGGAPGRQAGRADAGAREAWMSTPLYQLKAEFFKTLGHPARIRGAGAASASESTRVAEMLPGGGYRARATCHKQLAVLRRANLVTYRKEGSSVRYSLTSPARGPSCWAVARLISSRGVLSGPG